MNRKYKSFPENYEAYSNVFAGQDAINVGSVSFTQLGSRRQYAVRVTMLTNNNASLSKAH